MNKKIWVTLCLALSAGQAEAEFLTGNELLADCKEYEKARDGRGGSFQYAGTCVGYVEGVADAYATWRAWDYIGSDIMCFPDGALVDQFIRIVVTYLEAHPEDLHLSAGSLVTHAYGQAFPCPSP